MIPHYTDYSNLKSNEYGHILQVGIAQTPTGEILRRITFTFLHKFVEGGRLEHERGGRIKK